MTEEDKRKEEDLTLAQYERAKRDLAIAEKKGKRVAESIGSVSRWLTGCAKGDMSRGHENLEEDIFKNSDSYRELMNFDDVRTTALEIKTLRSKVADLKKDKESLGFKD